MQTFALLWEASCKWRENMSQSPLATPVFSDNNQLLYQAGGLRCMNIQEGQYEWQQGTGLEDRAIQIRYQIFLSLFPFYPKMQGKNPREASM
ncbi:MAG: hypothetical protein D6736_10295 [Nitrospinota bacterium]|nr:MAG: hypothetical protein D6736_10295 [Nitrospinota bacterium]